MGTTKKRRGQDLIRDQSKLAGRITIRMEELGYTQTDLAGACDVKVSAVGQWLRGSSKNVKLEQFFKLADKLRVEPRWLAINKGPKEKADVVSVVALRENLQPGIFEAVMREAVPDYKIEPAAVSTGKPLQGVRVDVSDRTNSTTSQPHQNSPASKKPKQR